MIVSGEKKEDYREIKDYWVKRLLWHYTPERYDDIGVWYELIDDLINPHRHADIKSLLKFFNCELAHFKSVEIKNGYQKNAPKKIFEFNGIRIGEPKKEWCGNQFKDLDKNFFAIKIGNEI